jgi:hypothetical protein
LRRKKHRQCLLLFLVSAILEESLSDEDTAQNQFLSQEYGRQWSIHLGKNWQQRLSQTKKL